MNTDVRSSVHALALAAVAAAAFPGSALAVADPPAGATALPAPPARVIVVFERGTTVTERADVRADAETTTIRTLGRSDFQLLAPKPGQTVNEAVDALRDDPAVRVAEPDRFDRVQSVPDDLRFGELWGLRNLGQNVAGVTGTSGADIDATQAWDRTVGTPSTVVADIDSGYRFQHPDLAPVAWTNPREIPDNGLDDDGNGFVDDTRGWDFLDNDNDPTDPAQGHGVHTAGTIGARGNDGIGVSGVAQDVRIMPIRICTDTCPVSAEVSAINYAGRNGARAANMSLGGTSGSGAVLEALAANPQTLFVISAGNDSQNNDTVPHYPCNHDPGAPDPAFGYTPPPGAIDNVVCVAATTQSDGRASFSDYGSTTVDLGAPGTQTLSTYLTFTKWFTENFEGSGFADWTAGGFVRGNGAPQTSYGIANDSTTQEASTTRTASTPVVSLTAGIGGCTLSQRRVLSLAGGDSYAYRVLVDGADVGGSAPTTTGTFTFGIPLAPAAAHTVQIRFSYTRGATSSTEDGVWLDDVSVTCADPPGTEGSLSYGFLQGTSMAAPHVTGAAALLFSLKPSATVTEVRDALLSSVDPVASLAGLTVTGGRLNVFKALNALVPLDTAITSGPPAATALTSATFAFDTAGTGPATFECRLDGASFAACASPMTVTGLGTGPHMFRVRSAVDGAVDASPAAAQWTVTGGSTAPSEPAGPAGSAAPNPTGTGGPSGRSGPGGPTVAVVMPAITGLSVSPARFAVNPDGAVERAVTAKAAPKGTAFRFTSATAARVLYTVEALRPGRRSGRGCVAPTRANRGTAACTRAVLVGRFATRAVTGTNRTAFSGRIGTRRLTPGGYRAILVATSSGRRSIARRVSFTVVAR